MLRARALEQARATALKARLEAAHKKLCEACANGGRIRMSIPTQPDDTDIVIGRALSEAIAYFTEAMLAVDPPPSGASPQADELGQALVNFMVDLEAAQVELPPEVATVLRENRWDLYEGSPVAPASPQAETSAQDVPVLRITVTRDVATDYYAAEFRSADDKVGGMGDYSATPVGALANLCATLIQIDEDNSVERRHPAPVSPVEPEPPYRETPAGDRIFRHTCSTPEDDGECMACSQIDCPDREPLHYHHDGCPCCSQKLPVEPEPCVWRLGGQSRDIWRAHGSYHYVETVEGWKVCPYCGAPLKVER